MASSPEDDSIEELVHQSPPLDFSKPFDKQWISGKTIVITGGASGLGEGFFRKWAAADACICIGDINVQRGTQLVQEVIQQTGNQELFFFHCDVTSWQSQVEFFKSAAGKSPHGGIDCVVASAGIFDTIRTFEEPTGLDRAEPPEPNLTTMDVNLKGVMYTTHLALFWLQKNPGSTKSHPSHRPDMLQRDRHLLLISSMAGVFPIPRQAQYTTSKHAVVGLFRSLRGTTFRHGVRVNLMCPYYVDTPLIPTAARILLAGGSFGKIESSIEAATRFVSSPGIVGRAVVVGPKLDVKRASNGNWELAEGPTGEQREIVEVYAHDFEEVEMSVRRIVKLLNSVEKVRGWGGFFYDIFLAIGNRLWPPKVKAS